MGNALSLIRQSLLDLAAAPPLLCFDEVDLLLDPAERGDAPDASGSHEAHRQVRLVLEALVQAPRQGAALLFIGQKLLLEPEPGHLFTVERLEAAAAHAPLWQADVQLAADEEERLLAYTRGNPLLLRLFATWQRMAAWRALGETYRDGGKLAAAAAAFREVLATYQQLGVKTEIAHSQALLAEVSIEYGLNPSP